MKPSLEVFKEEVKKKNINLSHQRLKILEYLIEHPCHPTVEQIYTALHKDIPTLSKTTVYNTLRILMEAGMVRLMTTEDNESRYDIEVEDHGHFKCESCGKIFDFHIDLHSLASNDLDEFKIRDRTVYFKGFCPQCLHPVR